MHALKAKQHWIAGVFVCGFVGCAADIGAPADGAPVDVPQTLPTSPAQAPGMGAAAPTATGKAASGAAGGAAVMPPAGQAPFMTPVQAAGAAPYSELPDGRGGMNIEQVSYATVKGFDKAASLAAFQRTLYPLLRANCAACHSTETRAQAPIHSDVDVNVAHDYALTRMNFAHPEDSKFVVRQLIDRHNCFGKTCKESGAQMLTAVQGWADAVRPTLLATPRSVPEGTKIGDQEISQWIANDRAKLAPGDADFMVYTSLHEIHNAGVSADRLNVARASISKALNSTARWAPAIVNPVDINGKGMVYRFDTRSYWGFNKGVKKLIYGGSDDDIFFGDQTATLSFRFNFTPNVSPDPNFAQMIWNRVKLGSVEAYKQSGAAANIKGFKPDYVEAGQLVYTLSRPDVYNTIMSLPTYAPELEKELGVVKTNEAKSYEWVIIEQAITIDARIVFRAKTSSGGFYWKTFDIFAGSQQKFPFWEHPIPKFVSAAGATPKDVSLIASLLQPVNTDPSEGCGSSGTGGFTLCTNYTGESGVQQSASEIIWNMPNGLQGYAIYGGLNQRRTDAFSFIVHDPRRMRNASDAAINTGAFAGGDIRLVVGASCMGCHVDGMNRVSNDMRDRLDQNVLMTSWMGDATTVSQVRELYPPSSVVHPTIEKDRRLFFDAMAKIRGGMILGENQNLYVEPIVWAFEWAQKYYSYTDTVSN
ncbi:MAG TPA: hypothetical protein VJV78_33665 [Polyangiales bacterium]|nr:hypothetical protein [Polyangiales bacterium]